VRAVDRPGGNKKRLNVCTSCIKAGKVANVTGIEALGTDD
jgi:ribosomal protein L28